MLGTLKGLLNFLIHQSDPTNPDPRLEHRCAEAIVVLNEYR